jgi:hypothetical protein
MRGLSWRLSDQTIARALAGVAFLGAAAAGGIATGLYARSGITVPEPSAVVKDMSPADTVSLRFPADLIDADSGSAESPKILAFASADGSLTLFNPEPMYPRVTATPEVKSFPPLAETPAQPKPGGQTAGAGPAKMTLAAVSSKPAPSKPKSNAVLSDSQIASIKKRLALTKEQERYWPAVEAELRKMEYKKDAQGRSTQGTRMAEIDMSKVNVEGLKSAGFPLVMSFNDEQRRELKSLAHLLGLESVMSGL